MAKVTITIEDQEGENHLRMDAKFEPKLEKVEQPEDMTPAQMLAFALFEQAREMSDPETYKIRSVN
jgi:hypothetical protein